MVRIRISRMLPCFSLIVAVMLSLFLGAQKLPPDEIFTMGTVANTIFFNLRLPRTLLCIIAGCMLGGSGAIFQMFFRNPLAEPGILGISAGSTLGAVLSVCLLPFLGAVGLSMLNAGAFLGAVLSGMIICTLAAGRKSSGQSVLLLCGVSLGTLYSAIASIVLSLKSENISTMYMWMLGSFNGRGWKEFYFIIPVSVVACLLFMIVSGRLDLLCCGEQTAVSLGVKYSSLRVQILIAGSLATSAAVCAGGTIGFVGLIAPHIVRKIYGVRARILIPLSTVTGAVIMLLSDTLCRCVIPPRAIPIGTVTAVLGVPFFVSLLRSSKRGAE